MSNPYPPAGGGYGGGGGGYGQQNHQQSGGYGASYGGGNQQQGGYGGQQGGYGGPQGGYGGPQGGYGGQQGGGGGGYGGQQGGYGSQQSGGHGSQYGRPSGPPPSNYGQGPPPPSHHNRPPPPPHNGDPKLREWFNSVDRDRSGSISAIELQQALVNGDWTPFDLDTVKMLMQIFDVDRSGTIGFDEFGGVWKYIKDWQGVFRNFDADGSGTIAGQELSNALTQFGYNLPPNLLRILEQKYVAGSLPTARNQNTGITFDRFVRCCVVVKTLTESFQRVDTDRDGWVQLSYNQFLEIALSAP